MQDQCGKSARQKDAHTCLSQELLFSRKYDLESERKSVNGHRLSIGIITSLFCFSLSKTYPKPVQNLSKTYPKPFQNLLTTVSQLYHNLITKHTTHTNYLLGDFVYTRIQSFSIFFHHFSQYQYSYQSAVYLVLCFYEKACAQLGQLSEEFVCYKSLYHAFALID